MKRDGLFCPFMLIMCTKCVTKRYNYGFVSGTASYCKIGKKWTSDLIKCPLPDKEGVVEVKDG
jgi:hypothetical protein